MRLIGTVADSPRPSVEARVRDNKRLALHMHRLTPGSLEDDQVVHLDLRHHDLDAILEPPERQVKFSRLKGSFLDAGNAAGHPNVMQWDDLLADRPGAAQLRLSGWRPVQPVPPRYLAKRVAGPGASRRWP